MKVGGGVVDGRWMVGGWWAAVVGVYGGEGCCEGGVSLERVGVEMR